MKLEMRRRILADLKKISGDEAREKSARVQKNLKNKLASEKGLWAGFQSMASEPLIQWPEVSENIQWCFPVLSEKKLEFKKSVQSFQKTSLGFQEPIDGESVELDQLQGVVVPGLAFDLQGHRLGRGRGFYDQTLEKFKGSVIGVCYQSSLVDSVPVEDHDLKCHFIITDEKTVEVGC
ncbi:MAG: 5-formyltetrahydrofolate cyclo-ligase [Bdellovibrio sp.]|nr:5-formyltetrahydrofolate cyclo-ligase [Bdellovibrio sp.]